MSSILRGLNENVEIAENSSAELIAKLENVESILGTRNDSMSHRQFNQAVQNITNNIKYLSQDELVMEIYSKIRDIAEAIGLPEKELEDAEDDVRKAFNNLEQAVYKLEEPFEDFVRDLQYKVEELEEIDEGQRCWKGYKKQGTKKMFGKTVNNCVKADESTDKDLADRMMTRQQQINRNSPSDGTWNPEASMTTRGFKPFRDPDDPFWKKRNKEELPLTWRQKELQKQLFPTESEEVDEGMYDQDAFDAIFKDRKQPKKSKTTPQDTGMYNQPAKRSPKYYDNHPTKRSPQHYDKGPETDQKLKETPKYIDGFIGADGKPTSQPTAADYAANKEFQHMKKTLGDRLPQPTKRDKDGKLSPFKKDDVDESGITKSSIGSVMEMYDDIVYLMYIDGKLAFPTPIEKNQKNKYERAIKVGYPDADVQFKGRPRHDYSAEELAEGNGNIRKALAGIILLGGLLGLNHHQAQKIYDQSHQLQQLTQVYIVAKERGDEAKMKDVKRRIGNHKMRLDLGKGDVDFDGRPGDDDIKDIDYINTPGEK